MAGYTPNCACTTTQTTVQANQSNYITVNGKQVLKQYFSQDQGKMVYAHIDPSGIGGVVYKAQKPAENSTQQKINHSNLPQSTNQSQVQTRVIYRRDANGRTYKVLQKFIPAQPKHNPIDQYSPNISGGYKPEADKRKPEDFPLPLVKQKGTQDSNDASKIDVQRKAPEAETNTLKSASPEEVQPKVVNNNNQKSSDTPFISGNKKTFSSPNSASEFSTYATLKPNQKLARPIMTEKGAASFSVTNNSNKEIKIERKVNRFGDFEYRASYLAEDRARPGKMKTETYTLGANYKYDNKYNHSTYNFGSDRYGEVRLNNREDKKFYSGLPRESDKDLTPRTDIKLGPGKDSVSYLYPKGSPNSTKTVIVDGHKLLLTNERSGGFAYLISREQKDGSFKTYISTDSDKEEVELTKEKYISGLNIEDLGKTEAQIKLDEAIKLQKEQERQKARDLESEKFDSLFNNQGTQKQSIEELPAPKDQNDSGDIKELNSSKKAQSKDPLDDLFQPTEGRIESEDNKKENSSLNSIDPSFFELLSRQQNTGFTPDLDLLYPKIDWSKELKKTQDDARFIFPVK